MARSTRVLNILTHTHTHTHSHAQLNSQMHSHVQQRLEQEDNYGSDSLGAWSDSLGAGVTHLVRE